MRLAVRAIGLAVLLAACQPPAPTVDNAWVRLPAVAGRPGAAYFTIQGGRNSTTLLAVKTPAAIRSELHESMKGHDGMMSMAPLKDVHVPAGEPLSFAPGGRHVMLYDIAPTLKSGASVKLSFAFADGRTVDADARVVGAGDPAP